MDPKLAQELMALPQLQDFVDYVRNAIRSLNNITGIDTMPNAEDISLEVKARAKAVAILAEILAPLLITDAPQTPKFDPKEYVV